jgi:HD-GYP domain-containing protein (c-di-GMP phosphodiesterase class II)
MLVEKVVIQSGTLKGQEFALDGSLSIGRNPENHIQLNDPEVSRKHALIQQTPAGTILRDLGSGNGTFVGDERVVEYRLTPGDLIRIGGSSFEYQGPTDSPIAGDSVMAPGIGEDPGSGVRFEADSTSTIQGASTDSVYQTLFHTPEDKAGGEQLRVAQERLRAIYEANQIIASENDLSKLFERVLDQVFELVPAHNGVIMLRNRATGELEVQVVRTGSGEEEIRISSSIVNQAMGCSEAVITGDAAGDGRFNDSGPLDTIFAEKISSAMCTPLRFQDENLGVIYVDTRGTTDAFNQGDLELLVALSGPAAIAIKNAQYLDQLQQAYQDTLIALANAIELRDHYTVGHTWRVTNFALETAKTLNWSEEKLKECEMGGVLHDIGKISIDDAILRKPGHLTDEEYAMMKVHPERGARMMEDIKFLLPLIPYALYHHERFDGNGYPTGLEGENIPIEGRLLAVADTFDAMTSNRPYRKGLDPSIAIEELEKNKGTQFDPVMVDAFLEAYKDGRIQRILQDYHKDEQSIACPFCSTYVRVDESKVQAGDELECNVCHRMLRLMFKNDAFYAELCSGSKAHVGMSRPIHTGAPTDISTPDK